MNHRIINRYLIREIIGIFVLSLAIFTLVLLMGRMVKLMEMVISKGVPLTEVVRLIVLLLPSFLVLTIPMAFLLAVLLAFGRLSSDNEITVLKASGVSLEALLPPVLATAVVAALLTLFISVVAVPWGNTGFRALTVEVARKYAASAIQERIFRDDLPGVIMYVEQYDDSRHVMQRVMIQDSRDQDRPLTIFAKSGLLASDDDRGVLQMVLENGTIHTRQKDDYRLVSFNEYHLTVDTSRSAPVVRTERDMGIQELVLQSKSTQIDPIKRRKVLVELHRRFAFPCAALVFGILAIPLGLHNRRSGKGAGFTVSILILVAYYVLMTFLETMAEKGSIQPSLAIWLPNVLFLAGGLVLFRMAAQEKTVRSLFPSVGRAV
jgi:lipopolysaccharide export system permease protein